MDNDRDMDISLDIWIHTGNLVSETISTLTVKY